MNGRHGRKRRQFKRVQIDSNRRRVRARDVNPRLGIVYDLLRTWGIPFFNDALTGHWLPAGVPRPVRGRSLKIAHGELTDRQHRRLTFYADKVVQARPYRTRGAIVPGGVRYHFYLGDREALRRAA